MTIKKVYILKDYNYYIYIISNWNNKVIYIGMTNDLERRIYEHKNKIFEGFSKKYNLNKLVFYEYTNDVNAAILREKEIKKWRREKKNKLIESMNPEWKDLAVEIFK
jgi:putative endonuclease